MTIEELKRESNLRLKKFIDCLGLDGDYYISVSECPVAFTNCDETCRFLTARSKPLKNFLMRINNLDEKKKEYIYNEGLIIINSDMKHIEDEHDKSDLYADLIHEKLHASRMLLINTQYSDNRRISSVLYDKGRFLVHNNNQQAHYADSSEDILKASIDDSQKTIDEYSKLSEDEKERLTTYASEYEDKMEMQQYVDESLVEAMSAISCIMYEKNIDDVMEAVKYLNSRAKDDDDIKYITSIIIRHNDLELFKWMLDPIAYEIGVVNYDFFSHYITEEDKEDLDNLYEAAANMIDNFGSRGK